MADRRNSPRYTDNRTAVHKAATLKRLFSYVMKNKWMVATAAFLTIAGNLMSLIAPKLIGNAIDSMAPGNVVFSKVYYYAGLMLILYTASSIMHYVLQKIMIRLSQNIVYKLRKDGFEKLVRLPVGYFDTRLSGDIISCFSYDVETVGASISQDFVTVSTGLITTIGSLIMMLTIAPPLVLVFVLTIPLSIVVTGKRGKKVRPLFRKRSTKLGELNGYMEETVTGYKTVKVYNQEETSIDRFQDKNKEAVMAQYNAEYYSVTVGPTVGLINNISVALISAFGAVLYIIGKITIGNISSFIVYSRKFSGIINEIGNIYGDLQSALSAAERVFTLIDEPEEPKDIPEAKELLDVNGNVTFEDVNFGYTSDKVILKDFNFHADSGQVVAIVGHTGAGKTTLINLLMRFYDRNSGCIRLDGQDIQTLTRKNLRTSFSMVLQDTWLFHGTIFDNIAFGKENATREEVETAAKAVHMHRYICSLPDGYNTIIQDDGGNLSQGQKQLLTIARAMLLNAQILILDEATSNVDTITEMEIQKAMRRLMVDKTCFIIAHRLSTIQNADVILVVDKGEIVERGTHRELLEKGGEYASLYRSQFISIQ